MKKYKNIITRLALCLVLTFSTNSVYATSFSSSSSSKSTSSNSKSTSTTTPKSSTSGIKSGSFSTSKPSKTSKSTTSTKPSNFSSSTSTKPTTNTTSNVTSRPTTSSTTFNSSTGKYYNSGFTRPTYRTYFTPSYYSPSYGNNFWSHYFLYQALSNHTMHPNTVVLQGASPIYSVWQDIISFIIIIGLIVIAYKIIKRRRNRI